MAPRLVATLIVVYAATCAAAARPNLIWIMTDDLGWGEPSTVATDVVSPHGRIATPELDRYFGEQGMVFTHAYAGYSVCAPSRTAFFTGRHAGHFAQLGIGWDNLAPGQAGRTLANVLRDSGYVTAAFGKISPLLKPVEQGFDVFVGQLFQGQCHNYYPTALDLNDGSANFNLTGNWRAPSRAACMASPECFNFTTDVFQAQALRWIDETAASSSPFFAYVSHTLPHAGGWGDNQLSGQPVPTAFQFERETGWPEVERDHAATIVYIDHCVGEIIRKLDALHLSESTFVFFASDNGAHKAGGHKTEFFNSTGGLRGWKRSLYEGGVRSPTMVRCPGTVPAGARSALPWAFWDVLPTFAELASAPADRRDGVSIAPCLRDRAACDTLDTGLQYFTAFMPIQRRYGYSVRRGRFKGVVTNCTNSVSPSAPDKWELYDLVDDPFETRDLLASGGLDHHWETLATLRALVTGFTCKCFSCGPLPGDRRGNNPKAAQKLVAAAPTDATTRLRRDNDDPFNYLVIAGVQKAGTGETQLLLDQAFPSVTTHGGEVHFWDCVVGNLCGRQCAAGKARGMHQGCDKVAERIADGAGDGGAADLKRRWLRLMQKTGRKARNSARNTSSTPWIVDKTPSYFECADAHVMTLALPRVHIIITLRDPAVRLWSAFFHAGGWSADEFDTLVTRIVRATPGDAIALSAPAPEHACDDDWSKRAKQGTLMPEDVWQRIVVASRYSLFLRRWSDGSELGRTQRLLVTFLETLSENPSGVVALVARFLGEHAAPDVAFAPVLGKAGHFAVNGHSKALLGAANASHTAGKVAHGDMDETRRERVALLFRLHTEELRAMICEQGAFFPMSPALLPAWLFGGSERRCESAVSSGPSVEEPVAGAAVAAAVAAPVIGEEPPAKRPKVKHNLSGRASYQSFLDEKEAKGHTLDYE